MLKIKLKEFLGVILYYPLWAFARIYGFLFDFIFEYPGIIGAPYQFYRKILHIFTKKHLYLDIPNLYPSPENLPYEKCIFCGVTKRISYWHYKYGDL